MHNPYEHIENRLNGIESLLLQVLEKDGKGEVENMKKIMSITEVADYLNLSRSCIYSYVNDKKIPFNKRGGKLYFFREELDNWVKDGRIKTDAELEQEAKNHINALKEKRK